VLWPEDTFVDFELGVNTAVKKLRQALADPAERPKFIETLPRIGYRFLVPVEWVTENGKGVEKAGNSATAGGMGVASERTASGFSSTGTLKWLAVGGAILLAVGCIGVWRFVQHRRQMALPPTEVVPLASFSGFEYDPAISPDGNQVDFGLFEKETGIYTTVTEARSRSGSLTILETTVLRPAAQDGLGLPADCVCAFQDDGSPFM
jgi:hypothetical protein